MCHGAERAAVVGTGAPNPSQRRPPAPGECCQGAVPSAQPHITPVPPGRLASPSPQSREYHPGAFRALQQETGMQAELRAARQQLLNHAVPGSGSPPTNASLSMEEREEGSCFSKGQLVAPGSKLGRFLPQGKGRIPPSAQHRVGPIACPSAGLLFQHEGTTSKTEANRSCSTLPELRRGACRVCPSPAKLRLPSQKATESAKHHRNDPPASQVIDRDAHIPPCPARSHPTGPEEQKTSRE